MSSRGRAAAERQCAAPRGAQRKRLAGRGHELLARLRATSAQHGPVSTFDLN